MAKDVVNQRLSLGDFAVSNEESNYIIQRLIRMLVLATNKHKLDYGTLRYIHRQVIKRSKLTISRPEKKLYKVPTKEEVEAFFGQINDPQIKLLFLIIHNCGLRVAEVCSIKVADIDFNNQTIKILGKGKKERIVPISSTIREKLQIYLYGKNNRFVFESSLGTAYSTRRIEQLCKIFREQAGIKKKITPHTFRHYFFSKLAESGIDVDIRAMLAGHSNTKTQDIYTHMGLGGVKEKIIETLREMEHKQILK